MQFRLSVAGLLRGLADKLAGAEPPKVKEIPRVPDPLPPVYNNRVIQPFSLVPNEMDPITKNAMAKERDHIQKIIDDLVEFKKCFNGCEIPNGADPKAVTPAEVIERARKIEMFRMIIRNCGGHSAEKLAESISSDLKRENRNGFYGYLYHIFDTDMCYDYSSNLYDALATHEADKIFNVWKNIYYQINLYIVAKEFERNGYKVLFKRHSGNGVQGLIFITSPEQCLKSNSLKEMFAKEKLLFSSPIHLDEYKYWSAELSYIFPNFAKSVRNLITTYPDLIPTEYWERYGKDFAMITADDRSK